MAYLSSAAGPRAGSNAVSLTTVRSSCGTLLPFAAVTRKSVSTNCLSRARHSSRIAPPAKVKPCMFRCSASNSDSGKIYEALTKSTYPKGMIMPTHIEFFIFLVINLIIPILYELVLSVAPVRIAFFASLLVFVLLQSLNLLRIRKGARLKRSYFAITFLNCMTLIAIGNVAFLSSIPDIWHIITSWL